MNYCNLCYTPERYIPCPRCIEKNQITLDDDDRDIFLEFLKKPNSPNHKLKEDFEVYDKNEQQEEYPPVLKNK